MRLRNKKTGKFMPNGGLLCEKRDKPCPDCGKMIMRKSRHCRSCSQSGKRNHSFGSDNYSAIHKWMSKYHPKEICEFCGETKKRLEWAKISDKYTRNQTDYAVLCHKCHMGFDAFVKNTRNYEFS